MDPRTREKALKVAKGVGIGVLVVGGIAALAVFGFYGLAALGAALGAAGGGIALKKIRPWKPKIYRPVGGPKGWKYP